MNNQERMPADERSPDPVPRPRVPRPEPGAKPRVPRPDPAPISDELPESGVQSGKHPSARPRPPESARPPPPESVRPPPPEKASVTPDGLRVVSLSRPAPANLGGLPPYPEATPAFQGPDPYPGCVIDGRYRVEEAIGEGGMGVVYRCRHIVIDKKVAIKVLRSDLAREQEATTRFLNEARAASAIGNPHIIDISDFGRLPDGATYFVMEYLEGEPLSALMDRCETVPEIRIIRIARQLAEGLAAAHQAGIVHRDLKPDNIFLVSRGTETDFVKILDFGIAKVSSGAGKITRAGAVFGTPAYMSPEQALGVPLDHRGDIYSLGVMLYELATGRVPFDGDHFMSILSQHIHKPPPPFGQLDTPPLYVSAGLEAVVLKCLSKEPDQRYASMLELVGDLDALAVGAEPVAVPELAGRPSRQEVASDSFAMGGRRSAPAPTLTVHAAHSRWTTIAAIAVTAAAVTLTVVTVYPPESRPTSAAQPDGFAANATAPSQNRSKQMPPARSTKRVLVAVTPSDAHVFRGGKDLGASPIRIAVQPGKPVEILVRLTGYQDQSVTLDGSAEYREVELEHVPAKKPTRRSADVVPALAADGIRNPWPEGGNTR
jgi:serine/threonine protein kinase